MASQNSQQRPIQECQEDDGDRRLHWLLLATALALPDDGKILAMDTNQGYYEVGLSTVQKAGVAHKIDFRESLALLVLDQLLQDETYHGSLDFIFVAVDKENYVNYHRRLLNLVKVGGLIAYERPARRRPLHRDLPTSEGDDVTLYRRIK
ncbi:hypothetical protein OPV22_033085 [Ensete ventricosum]|uniref:Uncharacterized protein n=1 Tax=Ensete ventricosum TaxID=4639 RepID=A0AAV8PTA7_ENSVE|nr:hypothetical protein OPV22_033085 [Ensete ventricosum]